MAALDVIMFYICYNLILCRQPVHIGGWTILSHTAALWMPFPVSFTLSFLLSRFVVFSDTNLKKTTSLFRYILLVVACIILNTVLLKFFVELVHLDATVSKILCTIFIAGFSYVTQRYFTFRVREVLPA